MMKSFPFPLPESLKSHLELFTRKPDKAIEGLHKHLKRRGNDAVGYFLLGWLYLQSGDQINALKCASMAKAFAPGSPFFNYLPYYFQHPDHFEAWLPAFESKYTGQSMHQPERDHRFFVDIDRLIQQLSSPDATRIRLNEKDDNSSVKHPPIKRGDDLATLTLARIYEQQGRIDEAVKVLSQIAARDENQAAQCKAEISRLKASRS
ncbi:MAG: tetratricopeptide repeat protein [Candidatus Cyclonatronum sp.]|uniref:tetratricopeptide repeat protein n=1 Tax=Cyclonatronum sp. TaxID=3024185 RepID=UPI0025C500DC|nr:tetratricopeptide repeat protein [Cyclonatronum sp.]MCH8486649.1 tetratricopeptide repeat protein [Cyclonatronum sp.]